jgi:Spy/CpxP family protein refolding chaperone
MLRTMPRTILAMIFVFVACVAAQTQQPASPYVGYQERPIKALSEQQLADLRAGRGMGLALAAELNGYPGPVHVLELAAALDLTPEQRAKTQALFEAMKAETVPLGERLIALEAELDRLFATRSVDGTSLAASVAAIGRAQAALRTAHLRFHLQTVDVLTSSQRQRYAQLRGYTGSQDAPHHHPMHR